MNVLLSILTLYSFKVFNVPLLVHSINEIGEYKIYATLSSIIYTDKNCYVIMMGCNNKTWVNKETGEVLKRQDGIIKSENSKANPPMMSFLLLVRLLQ